MINIKEIVRENIRQLTPYSSARDEFKGNDAIFLDANENPFGELNRYPDPYQKELKKELSLLKKVNIDQIFIGNGSDEVIDLAFRIFCNPGKDKAITFSPTYGMYDVSAEINNIELLKIDLNEEFQINIDVTKPFLQQENIKLIFICSPNNPTGNRINQEAIEFILKNFKGIVFIDEAYIDFSKGNSLIELISKYNNLIISQTFSKAWGLAAARVGIAYANEEIISLYNKVKPPYNVSQLNQKAAIQSLKNKTEYENNIKIILTEKEKLIENLSGISFIQKIYPSEANFILVEVSDADSLYQILVKKKIITRNRTKLVNNCIRITVGKPQENTQLINTLKNLQS